MFRGEEKILVAYVASSARLSGVRIRAQIQTRSMAAVARCGDAWAVIRAAFVVVVLVASCTKRSESPPTASPPASSTAASHDAATTAPIDVAVVEVTVDAAPAKELPAIALDVPTKATDLQKWLVAAHYKQWPHESKTHESDGPHGDAVKTFVSPSLVASLGANATAHSRGAAAVKELYDKAGKHMGWAVSVKVAADSASGNGWYWYEVFSTVEGAKAPYQGVGVKLCRECHSEGGVDQVLIPFPLQ